MAHGTSEVIGGFFGHYGTYSASSSTPHLIALHHAKKGLSLDPATIAETRP